MRSFNPEAGWQARMGALEQARQPSPRAVSARQKAAEAFERYQIAEKHDTGSREFARLHPVIARDIAATIALSSSPALLRRAAVSTACTIDSEMLANLSEESGLQVLTQGIGASLGPLTSILGYGLDRKRLGQYQTHLNNALLHYAPLDLCIATEYTANNDRRNLPALDERQEHAARNLHEVMSGNGGTLLLTQPIIGDIGTIAGTVGGLPSGLTVLALMKMMEQTGRVPTPEEVGRVWVAFNTLTVVPAIAGEVLVPFSGTITGPGIVSGNIGMLKLRSAVRKWHNTLKTPEGRQSFLFSTGRSALLMRIQNPELFEEGILTEYQLATAEDAAAMVGAGTYSPHDIQVLKRFKESAEPWFAGGTPDDAQRTNTLRAFIDDAQIIQNQAALREYFPAARAQRPHQ